MGVRGGEGLWWRVDGGTGGGIGGVGVEGLGIRVTSDRGSGGGVCVDGRGGALSSLTLTS